MRHVENVVVVSLHMDVISWRQCLCRRQMGANEPETCSLSLKAPWEELILGQRTLTLCYFGSTLLSFHLGVQLHCMNIEPDWDLPTYTRILSNTAWISFFFCFKLGTVCLTSLCASHHWPFSWIFKWSYLMEFVWLEMFHWSNVWWRPTVEHWTPLLTTICNACSSVFAISLEFWRWKEPFGVPQFVNCDRTTLQCHM